MVRESGIRRSRRRSAFTLLEVLIVMTIIVIILSLGSVYVFRSFEDAKRNAAMINAKSIAQAAQQYKVKFQDFPDNINLLIQPPDGGAPFIEPNALKDPWGQVYQYDPSGRRNNGMKPDVWTVAPDGTEIGNWGS